MRRLLKSLGLIAALVAAGTLGYTKIEGWRAEDSLYMTVITLSTVGYGETHELSPEGRKFTAGLIFFCLVSMTYWSASLTSFIVEQELGGHFLRRRTLRMISQLKNHVVICGAGSISRALIDRLLRKRIPVVIVDEDKDELEQLRKRFRRLHTIEGSPTNELTLAEANIMNARSVVATMSSEIDNLLVGITCKDLGKDVEVIARSNDPLLGNRMRKAGIDQVVSPSQLCCDHMADLIVTT